MLLISHVCAEFHDKSGAVLFTIKPSDRRDFIVAPESIRQDPLFDMLVQDGSIQIPPDKTIRKKLENDPDAKAEDNGSSAPADGTKPASRKSAEKKA